MIIHYIVEEHIFVVFVYKLSVQKEYQNVIFKTALKSMAKEHMIMPKEDEHVKSINHEKKIKSPIKFLQILKVF